MSFKYCQQKNHNGGKNKLIWKGGRKKRNLSNILCIPEICNFWGIPTTLFITVKGAQYEILLIEPLLSAAGDWQK